MPAETIETGLGGLFYTVPEPFIKASVDLVEDNFEDVPYLKLDKISLRAAPEIDACEFHYVYGRQIREGTATTEVYPPLDLKGQFVRVEIPATVEDDEPIVWYGQVMAVSTETYGTPGDDNPLGKQHFVAFGLLHLLDKRIIDRSWVETTAGDALEIEAGLPFNFDQGGEYPFIGNASFIIDDGNSRPVFAQKQRSAIKWSAAEVVKYLLHRFAPENSVGTPANPWSIDETADIYGLANWYEFSVDTDLRTVKDVIDDVLNHRRGMSYFVRCEPAADSSQPNEIYLVPFSFAADAVPLPSGATLAANDNPRELDFEKSLDVVEAFVSDITTSRYHKVRVFGEYMTTTFTTDAVTALEEDWTSDEENLFLAGASLAADYPTDPGEQAYRNAVARTDDRLRNVFTRHRIKADWEQRTFAWHDDIEGEWFVAPEIDDEDAEIVPLYDAGTNPTGQNLWLEGVIIERHLPLQDRFDYSLSKIDDGETNAGYSPEDEPHFIPLMAYIQVSGDNPLVRNGDAELIEDPPRFELVEKLNHTSFDTDNGRRWSAHVGVRDTFPGVEVRAHPPQMLGTDEWAAGSPAETDASHDPATMNGLRWQDLYCTMTLRLQKRVQCTKQIVALSIGEPISELRIYVPGARCDYVTPFTTVAVTDGIPIASYGGLVRDDRMRVADIARSAAEWYGDNRKTLRLTYKQVRNLFDLGWLITNIGPNYTDDEINTPITAIDYIFSDQSAPVTSIQTSFAELDYAQR